MKKYILILFILLQISAHSQTTVAAFDESNTPKIEEQAETLELRVFPNPARNQKVTLEMETDQMTEIRLVNIVGKEVAKKDFQFGISKYELSLIDIPKGIYLIQVKTIENKAVVKKLLVQGN